MKAQDQFSKGFKMAMDMEGVNQRQVCENAGVSVMTLRRMLRGRNDPLLSTLEKLCKDGVGMSLSRVFHLGGE